MHYLLAVSVDKCGGSCNTINNPFARVCVPDVIDNINANTFNLFTFNNESRYYQKRVMPM